MKRTMVVIGLLALSWVIAPSVASARSATVRANPSTNLGDGQVVTATVSGYPAHSNVELLECAPDFGDCDTNTGQFFVADASGNLTAKYIVTRMVTFNNAPVDCAHSKCLLVADDFPKTDVVVSTPITFDPNKPIRPPLKLTVSLAGTDGVDAAGVVAVHGTIRCNRPAALNIDVGVKQTRNGTLSRQFGSGEQFCNKAQTVKWQVSVKSGPSRFVAGSARVDVGVRGQAGALRVHASDRRMVELTRA